MSISTFEDPSARGNYGPAGQEVVSKLSIALGTPIAYLKASKYIVLASSKLDKAEIEKISALVGGNIWWPAVGGVDRLGNKVVELVSQREGSPLLPSTYVVSQDPYKYGNKQDDYVQRFQKALEETIEAIQVAVLEHRDLKVVFLELIDELGKVRHEIAIDHDTEDKELFGLRRDSIAVGGYLATTPLIGCYGEYDGRLMPLVQRHLKEMESRGKEKMRFPMESCLGRKAYLETAIFKGGDRNELILKYLTSKFSETLCRHCGIKPETPFLPIFFNLFEKKDLLQKIKEADIEDYKRYMLAMTFFGVNDVAPLEKKTDWVVTTQRSEVEGKMYALTQYVTWLNKEEPNPIDRMAQYSCVTLRHQDGFLIEPMLQDLAKIFERIVLWDKEDVKELKQNMSFFVYEFSHAMPYVRGTAAVLEILEGALVSYKGFTLKRNPNISINLEAICSGPKEFENKYLLGELGELAHALK
ncbi:MAG: hypothetical protein V4489_09520 [Chlamydiota bacterium]